MDSIQITARVNHDENLLENMLPKEVAISEEINLEVENNFIKQKVEP